jgi:diguanylate cyclase (GGDEF)-like protein
MTMGVRARDRCRLNLGRLAKKPHYAFVGAVIVIAIVGTLLPNTPLPRFSMITPVCYSIAVLGDLATALIVFAASRTEPARRSTVVLGLAFVTNASLLLVALLCLPLPNSPPMLASPPQFGVWVFVFWHVMIAFGALVYVAVRGDGSSVPATRRFTIVMSLLSAALVGACLVAAEVVGSHMLLPAWYASIAGLNGSRIGPAIVLLLASTTFLVYSMRKATAVERALALTLLSLTLGFGLFLLVGNRFSAAYYIGRVFVAVGSLFVLTTSIRTLLASRFRMNEMESTLSVLQDESAKRAGRFRAVWQIVSLPADSKSDFSRSVLPIATAAIRPGKPILGMLSHQSDDMLVVDKTAWSGYGTDLDRLRKMVYPGATFPLKYSMVSELRVVGQTMAWDDVAASPDPSVASKAQGFASFIGVPIKIGGIVHFLSFTSPLSTVDEPYAEDDVAYVDMVASSFATRFKQEQQVERIKFQIEHDSLTGLGNRVQFRNAVREQIRSAEPFALAFVDLDGFRHVNDRNGHQIGDELLVDVAFNLLDTAHGDFVARMSSDEFGIVLRTASSLEEATLLVRRYADLFLTPFHTGDRDGTRLLAVGASIGLSRFPQDGESPEDLMRRASVALDVAKARGGGTTMIFDEPMEAILESTRIRAVELSDAIANDQLVMLYQPSFSLPTRRITGAEALVRWDHPERGRIPPAEFIDFAERNGLIAALSCWVFDRVSKDLLAAGPLPLGFRLYFNVAPQMLDDIPFITTVCDAMRAEPKLAQHLGVEVTETAAMQNVERSMNTIALFRSWGLHVAIDDFGTGYSSLSYLKQLKVDMVKIDRSFITGLPEDERDGEITEMLLRIIDRFGFATLAEGVETEAQAVWLLEHGCRFGQGFLIAKPDTFDELLERMGLPNAATAARKALGHLLTGKGST